MARSDSQSVTNKTSLNNILTFMQAVHTALDTVDPLAEVVCSIWLRCVEFFLCY